MEVTTTFHDPPLTISALIRLRAAFENLSLILVATFAADRVVDRLTSSAWARTREPPDEPPALPLLTFAEAYRAGLVDALSDRGLGEPLLLLRPQPLDRGLDCGSTRKAPLMNGWIRQKYV